MRARKVSAGAARRGRGADAAGVARLDARGVQQNVHAVAELDELTREHTREFGARALSERGARGSGRRRRRSLGATREGAFRVFVAMIFISPPYRVRSRTRVVFRDIENATTVSARVRTPPRERRFSSLLVPSRSFSSLHRERTSPSATSAPSRPAPASPPRCANGPRGARPAGSPTRRPAASAAPVAGFAQSTHVQVLRVAVSAASSSARRAAASSRGTGGTSRRVRRKARRATPETRAVFRVFVGVRIALVVRIAARARSAGRRTRIARLSRSTSNPTFVFVRGDASRPASSASAAPRRQQRRGAVQLGGEVPLLPRRRRLRHRGFARAPDASARLAASYASGACGARGRTRPARTRRAREARRRREPDVPHRLRNPEAAASPSSARRRRSPSVPRFRFSRPTSSEVVARFDDASDDAPARRRATRRGRARRDGVVRRAFFFSSTARLALPPSRPPRAARGRGCPGVFRPPRTSTRTAPRGNASYAASETRVKMRRRSEKRLVRARRSAELDAAALSFEARPPCAPPPARAGMAFETRV